MGVDKILWGTSAGNTVIKKIVKETQNINNKIIKKCTVYTNKGKSTVVLNGDILTVDGCEVSLEHQIGKGRVSNKTAMEIFFKNFERLFDKKYEVNLSRLFPKG